MSRVVESICALLPQITRLNIGNDTCVYLARRFKECSLMDANGEVVNSWSFNGSNDDRGPYGYMGHYDELAEWVHCIRTGQSNGSMTVRDAAYVLAVEKAILASIARRQPVGFQQFLDRSDAGFLYS